MPSHLTRVVFRSIIANKPLLYRGCIHHLPRPQIVSQNALRTLPSPQKRTFFDFLKPRRKMKRMEMPPGLAILTDLAHCQRTGARPPVAADVAGAFKAFFAQKDVTFEDFHITVAYNAFLHLQDVSQGQEKPWFDEKDLNRVLTGVIRRPKTGGKPHLVFGRTVFEELKKLHFQNAKDAGESESAAADSYKHKVLRRLVQLLTRYGASLEARDIAAKSYTYEPQDDQEKKMVNAFVWTGVLTGLSQEGLAEEMIKTTQLMAELSVPLNPLMQKVLVSFFAERKDLEQAKHWYSQPTLNKDGVTGMQPMAETYNSLLKACAYCGDLTFGHEVVAALLKDSMPGKEAWDAIFLWSVAIGKGVDEVERMMNVMVRRNEEARQKDPSIPILYPDVDTINTLVEFSISKKDPYSAERYIGLGEKWGISPNARTSTMQIRYRISVKDLDGAKAAYFNLQGSIPQNEMPSDEVVEEINRLLQALCRSKHPHLDDILTIADDLHERKWRFAPESITALCILHLNRGEFHDAIDLLQVHAHRFSPEQRAVIRKDLAAFILDGQTSTADAWDTYQILRNTFPETPRDTRISIMNEFFARKRSDMACHVFFHMRNHTHDSISANKDVYVAAFTGFARCADAESVELAHNQLKLDMHIDLDTQLRNSLMLAYAATGNNKRALEMWAEIAASDEGPSYNSIAIAFRSCEGMPFGDGHAKRIWKRLRELDVEIDKQIWTAYMSAISRNHLHEEAKALVETVEEEYGFTPDIQILGSWYNTTTSIEKQPRVEEWIKQRYPTVWEELEALGHKTTMGGTGYRLFNLNRDLEP